MKFNPQSSHQSPDTLPGCWDFSRRVPFPSNITPGRQSWAIEEAHSTPKSVFTGGTLSQTRCVDQIGFLEPTEDIGQAGCSRPLPPGSLGFRTSLEVG
jgi:hypothetical protein